MGNINHFNNDPTKDSDPEIIFFTDISDRSSSRFPKKGFAPLEVRKNILCDLFKIIMNHDSQSVNAHSIKKIEHRYLATLSSLKKFLNSEIYHNLKNRACTLERGIFLKTVLTLEKQIVNTAKPCENAPIDMETYEAMTSLLNILCQTRVFNYNLTKRNFSFTISGDLK